MKDQYLIPNFICPLCQSPLITGEKVWQCMAKNPEQRAHTFDVAKQGYINLLPVHHKKSKNPGDSESSIQARQRFLHADFYQPLRQTMMATADKILPNHATWLDIGCGEGYYTQGFLSLNPANLIALDISKSAVIATVKTLKSALSAVNTVCLVASASHVPVSDNSVDIISSIFSPILPQAFHQLLKDNGSLMVAKPAENHLLQLRQGLFDSVLPHNSDKFIVELSPFFMLKSEQKVSYDIKVNAEQLADLLTMTPYSYRAKAEKRQSLLAKVAEQGAMDLTVGFVVYEFGKV